MTLRVVEVGLVCPAGFAMAPRFRRTVARDSSASASSVGRRAFARLPATGSREAVSTRARASALLRIRRIVRIRPGWNAGIEPIRAYFFLSAGMAALSSSWGCSMRPVCLLNPLTVHVPTSSLPIRLVAENPVVLLRKPELGIVLNPAPLGQGRLAEDNLPVAGVGSARPHLGVALVDPVPHQEPFLQGMRGIAPVLEKPTASGALRARPDGPLSPTELTRVRPLPRSPSPPPAPSSSLAARCSPTLPATGCRTAPSTAAPAPTSPRRSSRRPRSPSRRG